MTDERIMLPGEEPARTPAGIFEHWCEHPECQNWGGYGYSRHKHIPSRWYCYEHREDGEALIG